MSEKMLVTQALDEKDLLVKKIADKIAKASFVDTIKPNEDKVYEKRISKEEYAKEAKEKKILSTFSIEPSFKEELEGIFADMGLGWAAGIRFALKEFSKKYGNNDN